MTLLAGRTAIITGGGSLTGIGHATARTFAQQGARVAILDLARMNPEGVAMDLGSEDIGLVCDVRDKDACCDCADRAAETFGSIDILIGNPKGPPSSFPQLRSINTQTVLVTHDPVWTLREVRQKSLRG